MFTHPEDLLHTPAHIWHGVAIGWRNDINVNVNFVKNTHDRVVGIRVSAQGSSLLLVSFYAPTSGQDDEFLESISHLSEYIQSNTSIGDQIIIGADSNCSVKSSSRRQNIWRSFCMSFELKESLSPYPSFHHHNQTSDSYIDLFVTSTEVETGHVTQYCTLDDPLNLSSHDPLLLSVSIVINNLKKDNYHSNTYENFDRKKIIWDNSKISAYQDLTSSALSHAMSYWNTPETIPLLSSLISRLLVQCAEMVFDYRSPMKNRYRSRPSLQIRQAKNKLQESFMKWKKAGKPSSVTDPTRILYNKSRSHLQRLRRYEENLHTTKQNHQLMLCHKNNRNQVYATLKRARGDSSGTIPAVLHTPVGSYHGDDVLEGFAADAEHLGQSNEDSTYFNRGFYNLCKLDNYYIFDFPNEEQPKIPPMDMDKLNHILNNKMKAGKACDTYQLTVEHLRHCDPVAKGCILNFINRILANIYYLSCRQIKIGLGTAVFKGKNKSSSMSTSFRRITVSPILGAIIDYYIDPKAEAIFRPRQSPDQLGFTSGVSYFLAAIQRGECQRWAHDNKLTCFGVSLDGESAFPSVERNIQVRELYTAGERGDLLRYSKNTYKNTEFHMKLEGK